MKSNLQLHICSNLVEQFGGKKRKQTYRIRSISDPLSAIANRLVETGDSNYPNVPNNSIISISVLYQPLYTCYMETKFFGSNDLVKSRAFVLRNPSLHLEKYAVDILQKPFSVLVSSAKVQQILCHNLDL